MSEKLTDKQARFCEEYLIDLNATQAAIRAGYSENSAMEQGYQLLQNTSVKEHLKKRQQKLQEKTGITQERVLNELAAIAFSDVRKFYNEDGTLKQITELDDETASALSGMDIDEIFEFVDGKKEKIGNTKKIKRWDKVKALENLAKHLGLFEADNIQKTNVITVIVEE
jgi:phage terminase small subunit